jgi:hypothetical protein
MPHPADHPAVALAITRGLPGQMQKAKQAGDTATAQAIEAGLARARRIAMPALRAAGNNGARAGPEPQPIPPQPRPPQPPHPTPSPKPPPPRPPVQQDPAELEGWAEIVVDNRGRHQRRWR